LLRRRRLIPATPWDIRLGTKRTRWDTKRAISSTATDICMCMRQALGRR